MSQYEEILKKQGHHLVGQNEHSAVKLCHWLKKSLRDEGECYKSKFYGIASHRCIQMTPYIGCNQNCIICWRPTGMKTSFDEMDSPEEIVEASIKEQRRILTGYKGSYRTNMSKYEEAVDPKHAAISLIGEPTLYPYLEDLIEEYGKRGLTTFVVSNGTNPEVIEEINPTQLYISLESFEEEMYKKMCRPNEKDLWERVLESLEILGKKRCRTVLRITLVRGLNFEAERFIPLIELASPDYIEVKSYMHLGYSRRRLERDRMPTHREIKEFSRILNGKTDYSILDDAEISRVVLLSKDKGEDRMIDF